MLLKTRGIVFRTVKYSETSIIADIFTETNGLQSFIISGMRKPKSKVGASLLQVTSLVDMVSYFRPDRDLHRIKELKTDHVYTSLLFDVKKSAVGIFIIEICRKTIRTSEENRELFSFIHQSLVFLDNTEQPVKNFHIAFLVRLSAYLGFIPDGNFTVATPYFDMREGVFTEVPEGHSDYLSAPHSLLLSHFLQTPFSESHTISIERAERRTLLNNLIQYYRHHVENIGTIHAHDILETVFG